MWKGACRALFTLSTSSVRFWSVPVFPVGGVSADNIKDYLDVGAAGFGVGTSVYTPGDSPEIVYNKASILLTGWYAIRPGLTNRSNL